MQPRIRSRSSAGNRGTGNSGVGAAGAAEQIIRGTIAKRRGLATSSNNASNSNGSSLKTNLLILAVIGFLSVLGLVAFMLRFMFSTVAAITGLAVPPWTFTSLMLILLGIAVMFPSATGRTVTALLARRAGFLSLKMEKIDVWNMKAEEVCVESPSLGTIRLHSVTVRPDYKHRFLRLEFSGVRVELNKLTAKKPTKKRKPPFSALAMLNFVQFVQIDVDAIEVSLRGSTCRIRDWTTIARMGTNPEGDNVSQNRGMSATSNFGELFPHLQVHSSLGMLTVTVSDEELMNSLQTVGGSSTGPRGTPGSINAGATTASDRLTSETDDLFAGKSASSSIASPTTSSTQKKQTQLRISTTRQPPLLELNRINFWLHVSSAVTSGDLTATSKPAGDDEDDDILQPVSGSTLSLGSIKISASATTMLNVVKFFKAQQASQPPVSSAEAQANQKAQQQQQRGIRQAFKTVFPQHPADQKKAQSPSAKPHPLKELLQALAKFRADPFVLSIASVSGDWYDAKGIALTCSMAFDMELHSAGLRTAMTNPQVNIAGATGDATTATAFPAIGLESFVCEMVVQPTSALSESKISCGCITSGLKLQLRPADMLGLERAHIEFLRFIRSSIKFREKLSSASQTGKMGKEQQQKPTPVIVEEMPPQVNATSLPLIVNEFELAATNGIQLRLFSEVEMDMQITIATLAGQATMQREDTGQVSMRATVQVEETIVMSGDDKLMRLERISVKRESAGDAAIDNKQVLAVEMFKLATSVAAGPGIRLYRLWRRFAPRISHWKDSSLALKAVTEAEIGYNRSGSDGTNGGGGTRIKRQPSSSVSAVGPMSPTPPGSGMTLTLDLVQSEFHLYLGYEKGVSLRIPLVNASRNKLQVSGQLKDIVISGFDEKLGYVNRFVELDGVDLKPTEANCTGLRVRVTAKNGPFPGELATAYFAQRKAVTLAIKEVQEDIPISHSVTPTSGIGTAQDSPHGSTLSNGAAGGIAGASADDHSHSQPVHPQTEAELDAMIERFPFKVRISDVSLELEDDDEPDDIKFACRGFFEHRRRRESQDNNSSAKRDIIRVSVSDIETSFNVMTAWKSKAGPSSDASLLKRTSAKAQRTRAYLLRILAKVDATACPAHRLERALVHGMGDLVGFELKSCLFGPASVWLSDYPMPIARFDSLNLCARSSEAIARMVFADLRPVPCSTRHIQVVLGEIKPPPTSVASDDTTSIISLSRSPSPPPTTGVLVRQKSLSSRNILLEGSDTTSSATLWTKKRAITIASTSSFIPMKVYYEIPYAVCANLRFTWGECLNPALVAMDRALIRLLPGTSDLSSPKMGWWDKTRYLMHGKLGLHVTSGFEVRWLTGNSPYIVEDYVLYETSEALVMDSFEGLGQGDEKDGVAADASPVLETPPPIIGVDIRVWEVTFMDYVVRIARHDVDDGRPIRFMTCPRLKLLLSLAWRCRSGGDHYVQLQHGDADDPSQIADQFSHFRSQSLDLGLDFEVRRLVGNDYSARDKYPSVEFCWRVVYPMLCASYRGMFPPVPPVVSAAPSLGKCLTRIAFNVRADRPHILWWEDRSVNLAFLLRGKTVDSRTVFTKDVQANRWIHESVLSQFVAVEAYVMQRCKKYSVDDSFGEEYGLGEGGYAFGIGFPHEPFYCSPAMRLTLGRWRVLETVLEDEDVDDDIPFDEGGEWFQTSHGRSVPPTPQGEEPVEDSKSAYRLQIDEVRLHWTLPVRDETFRFFGTVAYVIRKEGRLHNEIARKFNPDFEAQLMATNKDRLRRMDLNYLWNRPRSNVTSPSMTSPHHQQNGSIFDRFPEMSAKMANFLMSRLDPSMAAAVAPICEDRWLETNVETSRDRPPSCSTAQVSADGLKSTWEEACREYTVELRWPQVALTSGRSAVVLTMRSATIRDFRLGLLDLNDNDSSSLLLRKEMDVEVKDAQMFATVVGENAQPGTRFVKSQRPENESLCLDAGIEERENVTFCTARGSVRRGTTNHNFSDRVLFILSQSARAAEKDERTIIQEHRQKRIGPMFFDICSNDQDPTLDRVGWTEFFQMTDIVYTDTTGGAKVPSSHLGMKLHKSFASIKSRDFFAVLVIVRDLLLVGPPPDVRELAILAEQEAMDEMKRRWRTNHPGLAAQQQQSEAESTSEGGKRHRHKSHHHHHGQQQQTLHQATTTTALSEVDLKMLKTHVESVCATRRSTKRLTLGSQRIVYELGECDWKLSEPLNAFQQQEMTTTGADGTASGTQSAVSSTNANTSNPPANSTALTPSTQTIERLRVQVFQMRGDHMFALDGSTKVEFEVGDLKIFDLVQNQQIVECQLLETGTSVKSNNRTPFLRADAITSSPIIAMGCRVTVYELLQVHLFPGSRYRFKLKVSSPAAAFIRRYLVEDDDTVPIGGPSEDDDEDLDGELAGGGGSGEQQFKASSRMLMMSSSSVGQDKSFNGGGTQSSRRGVGDVDAKSRVSEEGGVANKLSGPFDSSSSVGGGHSSNRMKRLSLAVRGMFGSSSAGPGGASQTSAMAAARRYPASINRIDENEVESDYGGDVPQSGELRTPQSAVMTEENAVVAGHAMTVTIPDEGESPENRSTVEDVGADVKLPQSSPRSMSFIVARQQHLSGSVPSHKFSNSSVSSASVAGSSSYSTSASSSSASSNTTVMTIRSGTVSRLSVPKSLQLHPEPTVQPWSTTVKRKNIAVLVAKKNSPDLVLELHRNEMGLRLKVAPRGAVKLSDIFLVRRSVDPSAPLHAIDVFYTIPPTQAADFSTAGGEGVFTWAAEEPGWQGKDAALPWVAAMAPGLRKNVLDPDLARELSGASLESIMRRTAGVIKRQMLASNETVAQMNAAAAIAVGGRRMTGGFEHLHGIGGGDQTEEEESDNSGPPVMSGGKDSAVKSPRSPSSKLGNPQQQQAHQSAPAFFNDKPSTTATPQMTTATKEEQQQIVQQPQQQPQQQLIDLAFFKYARIGQIQLELTLQGFAFINNLQRNAYCTATVYHRQLWTWYRAFKSVQRFETRKLLASAVRGGIGANFAFDEHEAPAPPHSTIPRAIGDSPRAESIEDQSQEGANPPSSSVATSSTSAPTTSTSSLGVSSAASWLKKKALGAAHLAGSSSAGPKKSDLFPGARRSNEAYAASQTPPVDESLVLSPSGGQGVMSPVSASGTAAASGEGDSAKYDLLFGLKNRFG